MKGKFLILLIVIAFSSCMTNYPTTTFYVKNTSDKVQNFKASILKYSSMGQFEMTLPFAVSPNDSIVARQTGLHKEARPTAWFTKFIIFLPTVWFLMTLMLMKIGLNQPIAKEKQYILLQ